jgi:hypothetical protein
MKKRALDFATPNAVTVPVIDRRASRRPPSSYGATKPTCPFCFQPGPHESAFNCLKALDSAVQRDERAMTHHDPAAGSYLSLRRNGSPENRKVAE